MKMKKTFVIICMFVLLIGIIYSAETITLNPDENGEISLSEENKLTSVGGGSSVEIDSEGNIDSGNLIAAENTEWVIGKETINAPKGTEVKIENGVITSIDIPEGSIGTFETEDGETITLSEGSLTKITNLRTTGGKIIESDKEFSIDNEKFSATSLNVDKKMRIVLDDDGLPTEIENARITITGKGFVEGTFSTKITIDSINCFQTQGPFACLNNNKILVGGGAIVGVEESNNNYFLKEGFFSLESYEGSEIIANIKNLEEVTFTGSGIMKNGNMFFEVSEGELFQPMTNVYDSKQGIPMEIHFEGKDYVARIEDEKASFWDQAKGKIAQLDFLGVDPAKAEEKKKELGYNIYSTKEEKRQTLWELWYDIITGEEEKEINDDWIVDIKKLKNPQYD